MKFPLSALLNEILICYDIALYNLTHASYQDITFGLQKFCMLYTMRKSSYDHYFFQPRPNLSWFAYITDFPQQDKDWYKDILVVDGNWEGDITDIHFKNTPSFNLQLDNDMKNIQPQQSTPSSTPNEVLIPRPYPALTLLNPLIGSLAMPSSIPIKEGSSSSTAAIGIERSIEPPSVIRPAWDHIALPANVSGLHNVEYAHALLNAVMDPSYLTKVCMSFEDFLMKCHESRYETTTALLSPTEKIRPLSKNFSTLAGNEHLMPCAVLARAGEDFEPLELLMHFVVLACAGEDFEPLECYTRLRAIWYLIWLHAI
ncbi:hypothetical protein D8674_017427 [Pyrus ussuriensis x Pyrus communis]|uniref:Uncharacterized protein n=1 Tax=Pyrus ussuriensis x Pyrus communis TaxID=2448454 RepID=A0A5N5HFT9_9ROSA|nr:hypothetical protein D8674_017427 [Pyrus ussuriensis x Pyrus communis]